MHKPIHFTFFLFIGILLSACINYERPGSTSTPDTLQQQGDSLPPASPPQAIGVNEPTTIQVYIENSGSMNGYVQGNTDFKDALGNLLVLLKYHYGEKNIQLAFINDSIYPVHPQMDLAQFVQQLDPQNMKVGNTASSDLNQVVRQVLAKTSDSTISILLSDCIYSIDGKNTAGLLNYQKNQTTDAFLSTLKTGTKKQTTINKLTSTFNGTYWDKNNTATVLTKQLRPYYMLVTGDANRMADFNQKINFAPNEMKDLQHRYTLTNALNTNLYYSVLTASYQEGRFKPIRSLSSASYVHGIEDATVNDRSNNPFTFAIAMDLSTIPVEETYKTKVENYEVLEGDYRIATIFPILKKNIHSSDWLRIQDAHATHLLIVEANSGVFSDFSFALKKQIPAWVYESDTEDDTAIRQLPEKTFGLKYMIEGIAEAYATTSSHKDRYFTVKIPIRKAAESNIGKVFVVLLMIGVSIGLGYMYIKRRNA